MKRFVGEPLQAEVALEEWIRRREREAERLVINATPSPKTSPSPIDTIKAVLGRSHIWSRRNEAK